MSLASVRARLKDRQVKAGALGTTESTICLDVELIEELERLEADLAMDSTVTEKAEKPRAGTRSKPQSNAELQAKVEAKRQDVRESSLRLVFRSMSSTGYQGLVNAHPDAEATIEANADWQNALLSACLYQVWEQTAEGEQQVEGLTWSEINEGCGPGDWRLASTKVLALNQRSVDLPFSLRSSRTTPA